MDDEYKEISSVVKEAKSKAFEYFQKLFVTDNPALTISKLSAIAHSDKESKLLYILARWR